MKIAIRTTVDAPIERVWAAWTTPEDIVQWNFASDDWCCPTAEIDLKVGGRFNYRMESKDGSSGFSFEGKFTLIDAGREIRFDLGDGRDVIVSFRESEEGVEVEEIFEADDEMSGRKQRDGWQAILYNFRRHAEANRN